MYYDLKKFENLEKMSVFSGEAIEAHMNLYSGYVNNSNGLLEKLERLNRENRNDSYEFSELKRRLGWEFDGMRLHEFFFEELGGDGKFDKYGNISKEMEKSFGGFDEWKKDFVATAKMRGIGWAVLYQDRENGKLINFWINEHNENHPAGLNMIINIDMFEHAFMPDFGSNKVNYIETFLDNLNWNVVEKRIK